MGEFRMPSLGADMEEATLIEWLVKPGDVVHRGDAIAVVDTVKTAMEVEAFEDGAVERLLVEPGTTLPVGAPMAVIRSESAASASQQPVAPADIPAPPASPHVESPLVRRRAHNLGVNPDMGPATGQEGGVTKHDIESAAASREQSEARPGVPAADAGSPPVAPPAGTVVRAVPRARRQAAQLGVDLATVQGTGPDGAVTSADVERAAAAGGPVRAAVPTASSPDRKAALQAAVGALMARSKREIPHYYLSTTIDMFASLDWLAEQNAPRSVSQRLVPAALLLKAAALAARRVPEVNGFWTGQGFQPANGVHLGVAISLRGGGLVAPAIHDADTAALEDVMQRLRDLVKRARSGRLRQSEMADPTITVTNLGDLGVEEVYGVIYPPQVALVGFGRIADRPVAVDGMLAVRPMVTATLCGDHRVSDGHRGARFLTTIEALLQQPEEL